MTINWVDDEPARTSGCTNNATKREELAGELAKKLIHHLTAGNPMYLAELAKVGVAHRPMNPVVRSRQAAKETEIPAAISIFYLTTLIGWM